MNYLYIFQILFQIVSENDLTTAHSLSTLEGPVIFREIVSDFDLQWYHGNFDESLLAIQLLELDKLQLDMELQQNVPNLDEIISQKRIELIFNN